MGRLYKLAYRMRMHKFADAQQDVIARNVGLIVVAIILAQWLLRGRPSLPAWHWLVLGLVALGVVGLIILRSAAARAGYVHFTSQPSLPAPAPLKMVPDEKEATLASGRFEVEGKEGYLANLTAYWRSFGSREHAVMAIQHPSRFLLGSLPSDQVGMWYVFFLPDNVEQVAAGTVAFGATKQPGLRILYRRMPPPDGKKQKKPVREAVHLAFETQAARDRVWADLLADEAA
jgi:hypothetical protein